MVSQTSRAMADFEMEVKLISNVHHWNLIRLLGCSSQGSEMLLVYEYMMNNSLDKFLFGDKHGSLSWKQRFDIIVGMARRLAYLHHEFHICIIHRDIKSSNVLLDDDFQPRIADFGLAKLLPGDQSHVSTRFVGTLIIGHQVPCSSNMEDIVTPGHRCIEDSLFPQLISEKLQLPGTLHLLKTGLCTPNRGPKR